MRPCGVRCCRNGLRGAPVCVLVLVACLRCVCARCVSSRCAYARRVLALCALAMDGHPQHAHVSRLACRWAVRRPLSKDAMRRGLDQLPCRPAVVLGAIQTVFLLNLLRGHF